MIHGGQAGAVPSVQRGGGDGQHLPGGKKPLHLPVGGEPVYQAAGDGAPGPPVRPQSPGRLPHLGGADALPVCPQRPGPAGHRGGQAVPGPAAVAGHLDHRRQRHCHQLFPDAIFGGLPPPAPGHPAEDCQRPQRQGAEHAEIRRCGHRLRLLPHGPRRAAYLVLLRHPLRLCGGQRLRL